MTTSKGHAIFGARAARLADEIADPRVDAAVRGSARPLSVAVHGRRGVGRETVSRALAAAGVAVGGTGDVDVHVVAEVIKPEDRAAIAASASARPTVVVLNKADLLGLRSSLRTAAPAVSARTRCGLYRRLTGVPTVPMVAHLAVADVDEALLDVLRTLAAEPVELGSVDEFVSTPHPLPAPTRERLLAELDLSGVAIGLLALRARPDADAAGVQRLLRRHSGVDGALSALGPAFAEAGYRRVQATVAALVALAATADAGVASRVDDFLRADDTLLARLAAAVDVVEAAGMTVDPGDDPVAHLSRAAAWHGYRRGPVNALHRACGDDIVRGSVRLWQRTRGSGET
jgi:hypothetical protein